MSVGTLHSEFVVMLVLFTSWYRRQNDELIPWHEYFPSTISLKLNTKNIPFTDDVCIVSHVVVWYNSTTFDAYLFLIVSTPRFDSTTILNTFKETVLSALCVWTTWPNPYSSFFCKPSTEALYATNEPHSRNTCWSRKTNGGSVIVGSIDWYTDACEF